MYIAFLICQPVHGDGLNLCLIYLADLHIKANHLLREEMYPNWNPRNTWNIFLFFFFAHFDYCDSLCSSLQFLKGVSSKPYNSPQMLRQCLEEKRSLPQLPVHFRIDCWGFYFHGSAGYVPWLYCKALCKLKYSLRSYSGPFWLIEKNKFGFFFLWLHMWGVYKKGHLVLVFGSSSYPYFLLHWAEGNIVYIRFFKSLSTQY